LEKILVTLTVTLNKRIENNDILKIMSVKRSDISPAVYSLLQHCQPTSVSVERSFSMLRKILAKDEGFAIENLKYYVILHFNDCIVSCCIFRIFLLSVQSGVCCNTEIQEIILAFRAKVT